MKAHFGAFSNPSLLLQTVPQTAVCGSASKMEPLRHSPRIHTSEVGTVSLRLKILRLPQPSLGFCYSKRGQVWSTDFSVSAVIFITMVALLFFVFNTTSQDAASQAELSDMQNRGLEASEALVRTPGYPPDWTADNVQILGLASEENSLDTSKIISFIYMDYPKSKTALGLAVYEYNFSIKNLNGSTLILDGGPPGGGEEEEGGSFGFQIHTTPVLKGFISATAKDILKIERYVLVNGQIKRLRLIVWR